MRKKIILGILLFTFVVSHAQQQTRKRADSFFGLHFDFHAGIGDTQIGKTLTESSIDSLLEAVNPDYIQVDCKGHSGQSSYPTKAGNQAGGYVKNTLPIFRSATSRHHTALYVHYSGVWDNAAISQHPQWGIVNADGSANKEKTSFFSAYADSLMIPQLKEISDYKIDGAWIDGDCWATIPDYGEAASKAFMKAYHVDAMPKKMGDAHYLDLLQFTRTQFKKYVSHYVDAIHQYNPNFQITSNWAYSGFMPEEVDINLDFLSGDLASQGGVYSAAFEARCLETKKKPWDLMAWGFTHNFENQFSSPKSALQLKQEAAEVLAMGGGFQIYFKQMRDGSIAKWVTPVAKEVGDFCRARELYCHKAVTIPQVAVLYSQETYQKKYSGVYGYGDGIADEMKGTMMTLLDAQYSVQVVLESQLKGHLQEYPLIVIPGWEFLADDFVKELMEYVKNGGSLFVSGPAAIKHFNTELGIKIKEEKESSFINIGYNNIFANVKSAYAIPALDKATKTWGGIYEQEDFRSASTSAATVLNYGKGKVAIAFANLGKSYLSARTEYTRVFLSALVSQVFTNPMVQVTGSHLVHVNVTQKDNKTQVHLINKAGIHDDRKVYAFTEIPSLHNLEVSIRASKKPAKVMLQPEGKSIDFIYKNGIVRAKLPQLDLYSILVLE